MNTLFIPHIPNRNVINRVYEFAKNSDSYFLSWEIDNSSFKHKIVSQMKSLRFKLNSKTVQIPLLFKPDWINIKFNTAMLNSLIDKLKIDIVVNANALLFDIKSIKVPVVYDLVDDHLEVNRSIGLSAARVEKIKTDIKNSAGVICVTQLLEEKVKRMGLHTNTITIENGVYIEKFQNAKDLRKELALEHKRVFGYIGGVARWTRIDKAIEQYLQIKNEHNAFLVVGGDNGAFYKSLIKRFSDEVIFVGQVAPEHVAPYFKTLDVGLIPFELNDFTHNALPIKALEYALAGCAVLSTPLAGLKRRNFSFVEFCDIDNFSQCMQKDFAKVEYDFNSLSWKRQSEKLIDFIRHDR
ncbi:glycosyltransferase family 4 protein [Nitratifractor sp.]